MFDPSQPHQPSHAPHASSRPAPLDAAALPPVGERLGVWRISAALFECASGQWYRVEHGKAAAQTAMALVYRHESDAQAVLMRFAEDSDALQRFQHPAWGAAMDSGLSPTGLPYLIVPAMEGAPLMRVALALPLRRRLHLLLDFIALLDAAQAQGLQLQELDPGMLWLSPSQQLHWLGQGLAPRDSLAPPGLVRAAEPLAAARQRGGGRPDAQGETHALGRLLGLLVNGRLTRKDSGEPAAVADEPEQPATPVASLQSWLSLTAAERESLDRLLERALSDTAGFLNREQLGHAVHEWIVAVPAPSTGAGSRSGGPHSAPMPLTPIGDLSAPPTLDDEVAPLKPPGASAAERVAGVAFVAALVALLLWLLTRQG